MKGKRKNWIQGKGSKLLLFFSGIIYLLSFFQPAYSTRLNLFGYECAYIAFAVVFNADVSVDGGFFVQILTKGHFLLLGLHNMIVSVCLYMYKKNTERQFHWILNLLAISTLNTVLFFFYNYFYKGITGEELLFGYYLWVIASLLIYFLVRWKILKRR